MNGADHLEGQENSLKLSLPEQSLATLSFSESTPIALKKWVDALPMANIGETARRLYHASLELNQLIVVPNVRLQLMETLRPAVHYVCQELSKHFLNQPVALPEKQRKIANLAQALQINIANGYKQVLIESQSGLKNEKVRKILICACHRVLSEYGRSLLRSCQLYCPSPKNLWLESHQIYRFAERNELLRYDVKDENAKTNDQSTIAEVYKQLLLLGCCKPNQLRQTDLATVYSTFEQWSRYVEITQPNVQEAVFLIHSGRDMPPVYRSLVSDTLTEDHVGLDTHELTGRLSLYLDQLQNKDPGGVPAIDFPVPLQDQLVAHLNQALGILTKRNFKRIPSRGKLSICVGLSATHYYVSGCTDFNTQLIQEFSSPAKPSDENKFLSQHNRKNDPWADAFDAVSSSHSHEPADSPILFSHPPGFGENKPSAYPAFKIILVNTSPGGYCLQWDSDIPGNVQAGEILGVREHDEHAWSIAAIRWIRQVKQQGTQLGIELLAPTASPCGVQLIQKTGDNSEYLRGLMLPAVPAINQPATLIVPRLPFQTGHKVQINIRGEETKYLLVKRLSATGSFSQFELKSLGSLNTPIDEPIKAKQESPEDDFDSLWPSL